MVEVHRPGLADLDTLLRGSSEPVVDVPDAEHVVVAATRQLLAVGAPLEAAHFLSVLPEDREQALRHTHVVVQDLRVDRAARKHRGESWVPGERADAALVLVLQRLDGRETVSVHEHYLVLGVAHGEHVALFVHPGHGGHDCVVVLRVIELLYLSAYRVPEVYSLG